MHFIQNEFVLCQNPVFLLLLFSKPKMNFQLKLGAFQSKSFNIFSVFDQKLIKVTNYMQGKIKSSSIRVKLKKYSSDSKFNYIQHHSLNKSPTKNVPSFKTGSLRFLQPSSNSPNKFYDVPEFKSKKSVSFGFGTKTNFAKKDFIEPTRYRIASSFDLRAAKKNSGIGFGISRQDFYKGKCDSSTLKVGPGVYNLEYIKKKNTFYMGLKFKRNDETISPGPGAYDLSHHESTNQNSSNNTTILKIKAPRIKTQYFQKSLLQRYNNKVPGPGSYELNQSSSMSLLKKIKNKRPKLPQCPRFKIRQEVVPSPGNYQLFSQFG